MQSSVGKDGRAKIEKGFTIVELLIVIVIIGVLASLVVTAYNGIQNRAKTASQNSTASVLAKKIGAYNTIKGTYVAPNAVTNTPTSFVAELATVPESNLTGTGITIDETGFSSSNLPTNDKEATVYRCGTSGGAITIAADVVTTTGIRVGYWNYGTSTMSYIDLGQVSGTYNSSAVGCGVITDIEY